MAQGLAEAVGDLLTAIALDLSGNGWADAHCDRMANSMTLGIGGSVLHSPVPMGHVATRSARPDGPRGKAANVRAQPLAEEPCGAYALFAGWLQNRAELAAELGLPPASSDSAIYAASYARHGDDCDRRCIGDYAAMLWLPERQQLRIARSPLSTAPIHVWRDGSRIIAASNPRMIFATGVRAQVDDVTIADSLIGNFAHASRSWFKGLSRVAPGSVEVIGVNGSRQHRFWSIADVPEVRFARDEDYAEAASEQLGRAIDACLEGYRQPGIRLSGGLDSQTVTGYTLARLGEGRRLHSYTSVPAEGFVPTDRPWTFEDETAHVRAMADMQPALVANFVDGADASVGEDLRAMHMLAACPFPAVTNSHWVHAITRKATQDGCDVMLGGELGNQLLGFGGETLYPTLFRQMRWGKLLREVKAADDPRPFWRRFLSRAIKPNIPTGPRAKLDGMRGWQRIGFADACPLREDYARSSGATERAQEAGYSPFFREGDYPESRAYREIAVRGWEANGAELVQGMRLLYGIEFREPLMFRPLAELCAGMPDDQFLRNGESRWLQRRVMRGYAPEMVRNETRHARQSADWTIRFGRERESLLAEIDRLQANERLGEILDFDRMRANLANWKGTDLPADRDYAKVHGCISMGISAARFINHVEGHNAG